MIVQKENPPQLITPENTEEIGLQGIGSKCYFFNLSWPAFTSWQQIPQSFDAGLKDIEEGRVVDMDIALTQVPSA